MTRLRETRFVLCLSVCILAVLTRPVDVPGQTPSAKHDPQGDPTALHRPVKPKFARTGVESDLLYIDRATYPDAYGILTSERLMFPVEMQDWPLAISSKRQLFVDDYLIASADGLTREYHSPQKHPGNPIMVGLPWEGEAVIVLWVLRDEDTGKFRMWYGSRAYYVSAERGETRFPTLYAESDNGIDWVRPKLGIIEYEGSKANNMVIDGGRIHGLFIDPDSPDPDQRYKAMVIRYYGKRPVKGNPDGYYLYTSPDGLHWRCDHERPIMPFLFSIELPQDGVSDTSVFRWDPLLGKYVGHLKINLGQMPGRRSQRTRAITESDDLIHWSRPRLNIFTDDVDEPTSQIYGNVGFVYESMWFGALRHMVTGRTGWKQVMLELSYSRDGRIWSRPHARPEFIPLGEPDSWEPDYDDIAYSGPLLVGDELWFYYRGARSPFRDNRPEVEWVQAMGLAKLRRDGFASLNAGATPGTVMTRPLSFKGKKLFVNADIDGNGWVKATVRSEDGAPLADYKFSECVPATEDTTRARITWREAQHLPAVKDSHVRLEFQLQNAKLYAFWVE